MFDYEKFENDVVRQMESVLEKWTRERDGLYIFSLDCARGMESIGAFANTAQFLEEQAGPDEEDYWYYKYCEEEWELSSAFEDISAYMARYLEENSGAFTNPETFEYSEAFDGHCEKVIEHCGNALVRLRRLIGEKRPEVLLALNVREYLDGEEKAEIFARVNSGPAVREYAGHIGEFT